VFDAVQMKIINALEIEDKNINLDEVIKESLKDTYSKSRAFSVKHEIMRLRKLSNRPFRVEAWVPNVDIIEVELDGKFHHLDKITEVFFENLLNLYNNKYTVGFEKKMASFVIDNKHKIEKSASMKNRKISLIDLSLSFRRKEPRLFFSRNVFVLVPKRSSSSNLTSERGEYNDFKTDTAKTIDISLGGLKIKNTNIITNKTKWVFISFNEHGNPSDFIKYKITPTKYDKLYCLELFDDDNKLASRNFIDEILKKEYFRLKMNTTDLEKSITKNIIEQFSINRMECISVFSNENEVPSIVYGSSPGFDSFEYFISDERNALLGIFEKESVIKNTLNKSCFLVVIKPNKNKCYARIISEDRLDALFLSLSARREDSSYFKISTIHTNNDDEYSRDSMRVSNLMYVTNIHKINRDIICGLVKKEFGVVTRSEANKLLSFEVTENKVGGLEYIKARSSDFRKNERYELLGKIRIDFDDKKASGHLINISNGGCLIRTKNPFLDGEINKKIKITFETLPLIAGVINEGFYIIQNITGKYYHLKSINEKKVNYVQMYINKYIDRLTSFKSESVDNELEIYLRKQVNKVNPKINLLLNNSGDFNGVNYCTKPLTNDASEKIINHISFQDTILDPQISDLLKDKVKTTSNSFPFHYQSLLVVFSGSSIVEFELVSDSSELSEKINGYLDLSFSITVFQLAVTKKSKVFELDFIDELKALKIIAPHKANNLSEYVRKVSGVVSISVVAIINKELNASSFCFEVGAISSLP